MRTRARLKSASRSNGISARGKFGLLPPQPKSDLSDLATRKVPTSGKPEFGRGRGDAFGNFGASISRPPPQPPPHKTQGGGEHTEYVALLCININRNRG
jgi:hypothetical protein